MKRKRVAAKKEQHEWRNCQSAMTWPDYSKLMQKQKSLLMDVDGKNETKDYFLSRRHSALGNYQIPIAWMILLFSMGGHG
jgi:hypothetical protein